MADVKEVYIVKQINKNIMKIYQQKFMGATT